MLVHLVGRHLLLRSGLRRLGIQRRCFCATQSDRGPDNPQQADMIRNRAQIKRVLCVAEKNDAAKGISEIMSSGRSRRREGMSKFNKIYEYEYHLFGQNVTVTMTSVSGHLLGLEFKAPFQKWHSCNPVLLFDAEVEKYCPDNMLQIKRTLEKEVRQCQALVIWTDCDREGENIGFEIIDVCKAVKPNLQVFRAKFSEITPSSIQRASETLTAPDANISDAVDVRQELDLRIGASFTRFQTLRLQKIFPESLANQLISYGSCQFPTLGFVVERFKAIQAFIPETFYKIKVLHEVEEDTVEFSWKRNRLFNHTACLVLYQICMEDPIATVTSVTSKPKSKWRPLPLDTVELEKLASRKLRINAKETMKIAEKLYTQGYISYPRTETNIFPANLALGPLVEQQTQSPVWGTFAQRVMDQPGGPNPRQGKKSDQAHPPIHPTKYSNTLQGNEGRVYEFIVRHFLACVSQDALGNETVVEIDIAQEKFSTSGLMILARNYLDVYPYDRWSSKLIPVYEQGSQFQPSAIEMVDGQTSPPQLLTEADLISLMEKHGIGTDATHAEHIETIKSRMYVGLTADQRFLPGELGMGLVEGYNSMGYEMSKPNLRAELEADLKLVSEGRKDKHSVLQHYIQKYKTVFIESAKKAKKLDEALSPYLGAAQQITEAEQQDMEIPLPVRKCPHCGRDMVLKKKREGNSKYLSCVGYPACKTAVWFPDTVLEVSRDDSICPTCQPHPVHMLKFTFRRGSLPPMMPLEFVGCIGGCDETLREVLDLKYLRAGGVGGGGGGGGRGEGPRPPGPRPPRPEPPRAPRSNPRPSLPPVPSWNPQPRPPPGGGGVGPDTNSDVIVCNCGQDALLLTVRKDGPNQGRQFYKCNAGSCNFFLWADQPSQQGAPQSRGPPLQPPQTYQPPRPSLGFRDNSGGGRGQEGGSGGHVGHTMCNCNETAVTRTVQKDGPNKGRMFHTCGKPRDQQCGFFQWADENEPPPGGFGGGFNGGGDGGKKGRKITGDAAANKPPAAKKPRTCGICHMPGHTRVTCPQR
ncbi:DNA topoisomerase 3-alpha isoform X1 [Micropterus dolomieu]|uniref:DNA topoisomerase 3-alpha isoform X1 n=1 Tax=Micropterus dolomieu TaxID=147949 RepID=UPI001E8CD6D7|nr:DNA topoisomerase 3-alpha isoform X1 [Micropterus dolomieu]XP_045929133.1 DNA topoisomerase 3-alpha isoform X1 [Micropterus dolomieu]